MNSKTRGVQRLDDEATETIIKLNKKLNRSNLIESSAWKLINALSTQMILTSSIREAEQELRKALQ